MRFALFLAAAGFAAAFALLTGAAAGTFPDDNGLIAYDCGVDVCTIDADGAGKTTLLTAASDPSWAPDGSEIAYVDPVDGIKVVDADGSTDDHQIGSGLTASQPSFSADGVRVAYAKTGDLWSSRADGGGGETHLTTDTRTEADPAYSPEGGRIAFARDDTSSGTGWDIWVLDLSANTATQRTSDVGDERNPTWSPTGLSIVYDASSNGHLFTVSPSSGSPTDLNVAGSQPAYAPDGTKIAFIDASGHLATMTAAVNGSVSVIDSSGSFSSPDWQPVAPPSSTPPSSAGPPVNTAYPRVNLATGDTSPVVGHVVTASIGTWEGTFPISYTYQWKACDPADPANGVCIDIKNAVSSFYTPSAADYGKRLRVQVTATNSQGTTSQNSEVTAPVDAIAPKNTATPAISPAGTNRVEQPLTVGAGVWSGSTPVAFTYSWRRCDPVGELATCVAIVGATTTTYTPTVADIGFSLRVWITGTNVAGSDVSITNHTFPIVDKQHFAPAATTLPTIVGTPLPGRQLTGNIGAYSGDAPVTTRFHWYRCDATGESCHAIRNASKVVYNPVEDDIGYTLRLFVSAVNAYGAIVAKSEPTPAIAATPPHLKGRRIVGTSRRDYLPGGGHDDTIFGLRGNDTIVGGAGDDRLLGGPGNDVITGGAGADRIDGGPGSDSIDAVDGERDVVECGSSRDRVLADTFDIVRSSCEAVVRQPTP